MRAPRIGKKAGQQHEPVDDRDMRGRRRRAAQIHKRLEKVNAAAACRDHVIEAVDRFHGVALTRGVDPLRFRLWPIAEGFWQEPLTLDMSGAFETKPLDAVLRELLEPALSSVKTEGIRAEHLAIISRWYYSSWRDGHWFPFRTLADLKYRKLVREISAMAKAETAS